MIHLEMKFDPMNRNESHIAKSIASRHIASIQCNAIHDIELRTKRITNTVFHFHFVILYLCIA